MSTFFGGEQLSQIIKIDGTNTDLDANEYPVIYTIPTGFYGLLKFAYIGNNAFGRGTYLSGQGNARMFVIDDGSDQTDASERNNGATYISGELSGSTGTYNQTRRQYAPNQPHTYTGSGGDFVAGLHNLYLTEGDKIITSSGVNNNNVRYELEIHLYKRP